MDMLVSAMLPPMPMVPTMERGPLMPSPRLMLTMELTVLGMAMVDFMVDTDTGPMVPTPTPMDTTARGPLRLSLRLTPLFCTDPMDTPMPVSMVDTPMVPTPMPMVPSMERGPLMPSPRLMLTMELTVLAMAMVDFMVDTDTGPMVPTPTPMVSTASKMSSQTQIRVAHQVQTEAQKQTKSRSNLTFSAINSFVI